MKSTTNVFLEGLRMDLHPLSTGQLYLTDALNATMLTYNGNEMMLQNDMGNTLIQDSATGNIMGLSPGFIPVGMKEHGGIMYIASVGKDENGKTIGEVGTIPSPIIRDFYKDKNTLNIWKPIPINYGDSLIISGKMYPTDKFIVNLQMEIDKPEKVIGEKFWKESKLSTSDGLPSLDPSDLILERSVIKGGGKESIRTPLISYNGDANVKIIDEPGITSLFSTKGVYRLNLYSSNTLGVRVEGSLLDPQIYNSGPDQYESKYWFLHTNTPTAVFPKDLLSATLNESLKVFPSNNKPGKLSVKLQTEQISGFDILPREPEPHRTPITHKYYNSDKIAQYRTYFPGFFYLTDSGIYIDKLDNITVIDESTNSSMGIIYPYKKDTNIRTFRDITASNTITTASDISPKFDSACNIYSGNSSDQLPQTQSVSDTNSFILSNIESIDDHASTTMTYSTEGDGFLYSGLFGIELGDKYNNWYRLELDYFDQYDEKHGTFTLRFNPYLNDVFGTNLSASDEVEKEKSLVMGIQKQITKLGKVTTDSNNIKIRSVSPPVIGGEEEIEGKLRWSSNSQTWPTNQHDKIFSPDVTSTFLTYTTKWDVYKELEYLYLGSNTDPTEWNLSKNTDTVSDLDTMITLTLLQMLPGGYIDINTSYLSGVMYLGGNLNIDYDWDNGGRPITHNGLGTIVFVETGISFSDGRYTILSDFKNSPWILSAYDTSDTVTTKKDLASGVLYPVNLTYTLQTDKKLTVQAKYEQDVNFYFRNLHRRLDDGQYGVKTFVSNDALLGSNSDTRIRWAYHGYHRFALTKLISLGAQELSIEGNQEYTPSYQITPYFTLKGKNDSGESVYVRRFGKIDGADMTYECNLQEANGFALNYIADYGGGSETPNPVTSALCSYNEIKELKFIYYKDNWSESVWLEPGVYVLNIQKCPPMTNWIYRSSDKKVLVDLTIDIDGDSYKYSADPDNRHWIKEAQLNNGLKRPSGIEGFMDANRYYIYHPIILIVKSGLTVNFSIANTGEEHKFHRQSIGLYKISTIKSEDFDTVDWSNLDISDSVMLYLPYMEKVLKTFTDTLNYPKSVEQRNLIQKYGAFLKEGYVFIDGVVDTGGLIKQVTIGDTSYGGYPYIPSDPSILPVSINESMNGFTWNAYIMPESVLTDPTFGDFKFSNPIPGTTYSVEAKEGNLREPYQSES